MLEKCSFLTEIKGQTTLGNVLPGQEKLKKKMGGLGSPSYSEEQLKVRERRVIL